MSALSLLLRLRPEQITHFREISGVDTTLTPGELQSWQHVLQQLDDWLKDGNTDQLRAAHALLTPLHKTAEDDDILSTTLLDDRALAAALANGATPFRPGPAVLPPASPPITHPPTMGATTTISEDEIAAAIGRLPAASTPPMAIGDYAQLVAQTEPGAPYASGEGRRDCHHHHHITDESHRTAIDSTFRTLFGSNPQAWTDYSRALHEWRQWLKRAAKPANTNHAAD